MRVLALHGIGHADARRDWQDAWRSSVERALAVWTPAPRLVLEFLAYDDLFAARPLHAPAVLEALARLAASGLFHGVADGLRGRRGLGDVLESLRWSAGMVAQWVADERLRARLRTRLARAIRAFAPDVILAHSLGSLIAYDTLRRDEVARPRASLARGRTLVTLGSQLGNPAVRSVLGGRVEPLASARFWWHLHNERDRVFATPLELEAPERFRRVATPFDAPGLANHAAPAYLAHAAAIHTVWSDVAQSGRRSVRGATPRAARRAEQPTRRALLIGIADYPNAGDGLDGPVNDVFRMSATLQEVGFAADEIRVVLNARATARGIRERLRWLLGGARPGDTLVLHFAGHGAQIPGYGRDAEVDRIDECLVPYDFDWSLGTAITDDELCGLYAQLPYQARFVALFDCCHSGGLARAGGARVRALAPPDDVRHRMLRWRAARRAFGLRERFTPHAAGDPRLARGDDAGPWLGESGGVRRLGRGTSLWSPRAVQFVAARAALGHLGPYAPVLLEACAEHESAYEVRDGATSHGAFTFAVTSLLQEAARGERKRRARLSFARLVAEARARVRTLVPDPQRPQLVCPRARRRETFPGL